MKLQSIIATDKIQNPGGKKRALLRGFRIKVQQYLTAIVVKPDSLCSSDSWLGLKNQSGELKNPLNIFEAK